MPVTVVVGGQFGSEGKGKVAHWFARELRATTAVRVGGPNSGHTVLTPAGTSLILKQLPTAAILPGVTCVIAAGSYVAPQIVLDELRSTGLPADRLIIDPNAIVITERELEDEKASGLRGAIGSTASGTGAAVLARVRRDGSARLARDEPLLSRFVHPATAFLRDVLQRQERVIVEGTQGFGLSVLHSPHYPFATSRDTTASAFVAEAGLSPLDVDDVVLVIRAFPIRVPGNSGPLRAEITWEQVTAESGSPRALEERTSVTRTIRRVARFDPVVVRLAIAHNAPTRIVLNHVDHVDAAASLGTPTARSIGFVRATEAEIGCAISHVGLGPAHVAVVPSATASSILRGTDRG